MSVSKLKVLSNVQVSDRYWQLVADSSLIQESIQPGQFFNIKCANDLNPLLRRPLSIYRINRQEKTIEFLYLVKGEGTKRMTMIAAGENVDVLGPLGKGFTLSDDWKTILLVARGVGIATLAALAQDASEKNIKPIAVLSARSQNDLLAAETLKALGAKIYKVTDEDGTSGVGDVHQLIKTIFMENHIDAVFTCGSKRLSIVMQTITNEYRIPGQIALEEQMACAMGVCYACVCDVKDDEGHPNSVRVCKDGPVFDLQKVVLG